MFEFFAMFVALYSSSAAPESAHEPIIIIVD
jgi:hypothetical protein